MLALPIQKCLLSTTQKEERRRPFVSAVMFTQWTSAPEKTSLQQGEESRQQGRHDEVGRAEEKRQKHQPPRTKTHERTVGGNADFSFAPVQQAQLNRLIRWRSSAGLLQISAHEAWIAEPCPRSRITERELRCCIVFYIASPWATTNSKYIFRKYRVVTFILCVDRKNQIHVSEAP